MSCAASPAPARFLENALVFTLIAHAAGMGSMVLFLLPGMPGGPNEGVAARAAHVAAHPWLWRIGWMPWQVTAASDLLLCLALLRTPWVPRLPAVLATIATSAGIVPDQAGQAVWTWEGVRLARAAAETGGLAEYLEFETDVFRMTAGWGPVGYILGAVAWSWCFAAAGIWSRRLTWLSVAAWGVFAAATSVLFLPEPWREAPGMAAAVSIGNAVAFVLLMVWLVEVTERVLGRSRATADYGGHAAWVHPSRSLVGWMANVLANSRLIRALGRLIPGAAMGSDIRDVVYVNYLVPAAALERFVVPPLQLQRLGPGSEHALFTFLTYRHGHFGPVCFGPLRRVWPSPVQTNWRIHVWNPATGTRGIQFLTTAITSSPHALATRLLADGVPMHVPARACVERNEAGAIRVEVDPGRGSAPDVRATLAPAPEPVFDGAWKDCFGDWRGFLAYCVPQDRAMGVLPGGAVLRQEIDLGIPLESCKALAGMVRSAAARKIVGDAAPVCFLVERVRFRFAGQRVDR